MMVRTADGVDHGGYTVGYCLEAVIETYEDGYILCPILSTGGKCEMCYEVFERRMEWNQDM